MALAAGTRLGVYEVTAPIGEGGMGQVYRATDTTLGRQVAIKILPDAFASDPERLARFEREAKTLASLNHPNIAAIYAVEKSAGLHALVMELVEGEDLSQRIARGAIPLDEALPIAKQIAEALEAAHEQGIIHRDLKPANIKVRADGTVKVLDFGLAKAMEPTGAMSPSQSMSPTITTPAMTQAGMILGTAAYMSPEQARGTTVDKRSDIWAYGCVCYEMLTGKRAFVGDDVSITLASVLMKEPEWGALPADLPSALGTYIRRCLHKDPKQRIHDIADVRLALEGAFETAAPQTTAGGPAHAGHDVHSTWRRLVAPVAAALVLAAVASALTWFAMRPAAPVPPRVTRTTVSATGPAALTLNGADRDLAITPDGSRVVYVGNRGTQLFVRALDALAPVAVFTGAPRGPFVSPDGQWVGFVDAGNLLRKMAVTGGPAVTLAALDGAPRGANWGPDGTVIVATNNPATGLQQVATTGGATTVLTRPDRAQGEADHLWPELLPGGRAALFTIMAVTGGLDAAQVAVLDLQTGTRKILVRGGSHAHYVPSGHLVYAAAGTLRAVAFDLASLETRGTPVPVVPDVATTGSGAMDAVVAGDGTLAYVSGGGVASANAPRTLVWVSRGGQEEAIPVPPRAYTQARLSPDGSRIALDIRDQKLDIWTLDIARLTLTRLTFDDAADDNPLWTPDGQRLVFHSTRGSQESILWQRADGTGDAEVIVTSTSSSSARIGKTISADGAVLVFLDGSPQQDLLQVSLGGNGQPTTLIGTMFDENQAEISPDGRWVAYQSNESGRLEIYVRPFPDVNRGKWQVSTAGGSRPLWSRGGEELVFVDEENALNAVSVRTTAAFAAGIPRKLFEPRYYVGPARAYDVTRDGQRFLMIKEGGTDQTAAPQQIIVVQHFDEELKRLVPTK